MGGEWYHHQGGGVNYLCLPHNPKYDRYNDGDQASGYVYGAEYQVSSYSGESVLLVIIRVKGRTKV